MPLIAKENEEKQKAHQFKPGVSGNPTGKKKEQARTISSEPARDHKAEDARSTVGQVAARAKVSRHKARQAIAVVKAVEAGELPKTVIDDVIAGKKQLKEVAPKSPKEDKGEEVARIAEPSQPCLPGMGNPRPNLSKAQVKDLPPCRGRVTANRAIRILDDIQDHDAELGDAIKLLRSWCDQKESKTQGHQECLPGMENTRPILTKAQVKALPPRMGWQIAGRAIWVLEAIEKNDADRARGFQRVKDWIAANETVSQASREVLPEIAAPITSLAEPEAGRSFMHQGLMIIKEWIENPGFNKEKVESYFDSYVQLKNQGGDLCFHKPLRLYHLAAFVLTQCKKDYSDPKQHVKGFGMRELNDIERGDLVKSAWECYRSAERSLSFAECIKAIIHFRAWEKRFQCGKVLELNSFRELITAKPHAGWGEDPKKIEAVIKDDPEALTLFRDHMAVKHA